MKKQRNKTLTIASTLALIALALSSCTTNWPQFRGPENNMIAKGKNLPVEWGDSLNIRWSLELEGEGWASPVVWGKKVFLISSLQVKQAAEPEPQEAAHPRTLRMKASKLKCTAGR